MLEGDHLICHWLNVGRMLMKPDDSWKIQPVGKMVIPIDISPPSADLSWTSTAELTANMKIAVFFLTSFILKILC